MTGTEKRLSPVRWPTSAPSAPSATLERTADKKSEGPRGSPRTLCRGGDARGGVARDAKLHHGPAACDPLPTTEILLIRDAKDKDPDGTGAERLTANNGTNCTDHSGGLTKYEKLGAVQTGGGLPSTMFRSVVAKAGRTCVPDGVHRELEGDGFLEGSVRHGHE